MTSIKFLQIESYKKSRDNKKFKLTVIVPKKFLAPPLEEVYSDNELEFES